jgi:hypothetical protein
MNEKWALVFGFGSLELSLVVFKRAVRSQISDLRSRRPKAEDQRPKTKDQKQETLEELDGNVI